MQPDDSGSIIPVYKPLYWTSFDVVHHIRKRNKKIKTGHAGTLDPMAEGLMLICTGKKTKDIEVLQNQPKVYSGTICFGARTPSLDMETQAVPWPVDHVNVPDNIHDAVQKLTGEIMQSPPVYSAIKTAGKRSYDLVRSGTIPVLKVRQVSIYKFDIFNLRNNLIDFRICCSRGTYIRSMAEDIGKICGVDSFLCRLIRESIGSYTITESQRELIQISTAKSRIMREKVLNIYGSWAEEMENHRP